MIPVFASKFAAAWPKHDTGPAPAFVSLEHALVDEYPTDAHFAAYSVPSIARRLDSGAADRVFGGIPLVALVVDVDAPGKAATPEWRAAERAKVARVGAEFGAEPFAYDTAGGYRVVFELPTPFVIESTEDATAWKRFYLRSLAALSRRFGIVGDPACHDWTRLFRVPHGTRDGTVQRLPTSGDPANVAAWRFGLDENELADDGAELRRLAADDARWRSAAELVALSAMPFDVPRPSPPSSATSRSLDDKRNRARAYLAKADPSIEGSGGSNVEIRVANAIAVGFDLDEDEAFALLLTDYNPRCVPPWSARELRRKVSEAVRTTKHVRGYLLDARPDVDGAKRDAEHASYVTANDDAAVEAAERSAIVLESAGPAQGVTDPCTDLANADRLVAFRGSDFRWVSTWGKSIAWTGKCWRADEPAVQRFAAETSRRMLASALDAHRVAVEADAAAKAVGSADTATDVAVKRAQAQIKWATKSQSVQRLAAMTSLARTSTRVVISHDLLDADPWALNVTNGTIDLRTGGLRPHRREDHITKIAPVAYDPSAQAPTWLAFLDRAMGGDLDVLEFLQRAVGYSLTGEIGEHALFFSHGGGANGKSTFFGALHRALGDYATAAPRGLLFTSKHEQHPTELAALQGARFVTCSEIEEDRTFDEAKIKDLTGGDVIEARRMREDFWSLRPTHKLWLAGNHKPRVRGTDDGIWRRLRIVPWTVQIPAHERDRDLPTKLADELPGILAWAVRGCLEWQRGGLGEPAIVVDATAAYREESDPLAEFFASWCVFAPDARISRKMLRCMYEAWAEENGIRFPLDARKFAAALRLRGVDPGNVKHEGRVVDGWKGVRYATEAERESSGVGRPLRAA